MSEQEKLNESIKLLIKITESDSELKQRLIDQDVYSTDLEFYKDTYNLLIALSTIKSRVYELRAETKYLNEVIENNNKITEENKIKLQKLLN